MFTRRNMADENAHIEESSSSSSLFTIHQALETVQRRQSPSLPIFQVLDQVQQSLMERPNLLLEAPPGAGKTTILPLALLTQLSKWNNKNRNSNNKLGKILVVEPRRVATRSAAIRMATLLQQSVVGETVGYTMRGETAVHPQSTRITVVTDGVLLQQLRNSNNNNNTQLTGVDAVLLDEFHERGVNSDVGLALLLEMQRASRPELRIVVMSATLFDENHHQGQQQGQENVLFRAMGGRQKCTIVRSQASRQYPTRIQWGSQTTSRRRSLQVLLKDRNQLVQVMCHAIQEAAQQAPARGDVLAFLPGAREIQRVVQELSNTLRVGVPTNKEEEEEDQLEGQKQSYEILPLYGTLPKREQDYAICPPPADQQHVQRIIVASPIAEASLTLERVTAVVDSGLRRQAVCDVDTGLPRLVTRPCSKAAATQRAGRAGRVQEGFVLRVYSSAEMQERFLDHSLPEIASTDLVPTVLLLVDWGCSTLAEVNNLPFVTLPDPAALQRAFDTLVDLGALDKKKQPVGLDQGHEGDRYILTEHGRAICRLPTHPRLATAIVKADTIESLVAAVVTASFLDDDSGVRGEKSADLRPRIRDILRGDTNSIERNRVLQYAARMGKKAKAALISIMQDDARIDSVLCQVGEAILPGFIDLVAQRKGDASYGGSTYMLSLGRTARLDDERDSADYVVVAETSTGDDGITRIRSYAPISIDSLYNVAQERDMTFTVPSRGYEVRSRRSLVVGSLELSSTPLPAPSGEQVSRILRATIRSLGGVSKALMQNLAKDDQALLDELRARVRLASSMACDNEGNCMEWPTCFVALDALENNSANQSQITVTEDLVEPWLASAGSLKKLNMLEILKSSMSSEQQMALDQLFPVGIVAPDGTRIPISYASGTPTASAKLQQFFGTTESPAVGPLSNRTAVSLSLLSPAGKLLAQTSDLVYFWRETYPTVRAEMRGRYDKHPWPEDPMTALPTRQTKNQQNQQRQDASSSVESNGKNNSAKKKKGSKKRKR